MAVVIAVSNQKGGVAKTTTACALSTGLAKRGYRVLMVDTDSQRNSTGVYRAERVSQPFTTCCSQKTLIR